LPRGAQGETLPRCRLNSPKTVDLVLNLKEAGALGIKVPSDLITDATQVIK
jgi:hypothetical protein